MDEAYKRVSALGGRFTSLPADAPNQEPMSGTSFAYFEDPDGLMVELLQPGAQLSLDVFLGSV